MKRKAVFRLVETRRERLYVNDEFDHVMMLVEAQGEPIEYEVGVAGAFVSRHSVTFHDRVRGTGEMKGYAVTTFQNDSVCSGFEGRSDAQTGLTSGTWKVRRGTGRLAGIKGTGAFTVRKGRDPGELIFEMTGDYDL